MTANPISSVRLTKKIDEICYRKYPANPVFECHLDPDILQRLISDPCSILKKNPKTIFFWPCTLINCIGTSRQFVFETFPTRDTNKPQIDLAARTLFQLDGDMLLKIDEHILTRTDGIEILKAHFCWTNWCFKQLKSLYPLTIVLRCPLWLPPLIGLSVGGVMSQVISGFWYVIIPIVTGIILSVIKFVVVFLLKRKIGQFV